MAYVPLQIKNYPILSACRLWLEEPRLMNPESNIDLPGSYNPEFLNQQSDVNSWLQFLDVIVYLTQN